jgi:secretion/DNA translocation related TadE-like protein
VTERRPDRRPDRDAHRADHGSATVLVITAILLLSVLAAAVMVVLALIATQVRASQAADLAALAGAEKAWFGSTEACREARRIAAVHGAGVERCTWQGLDVQVHVVVTVPVPQLRALSHGQPLQLRAVARAGPPTDVELAALAGAQRATGQVSSESSSRTAPALSSGLLALPHLGLCTQRGQPSSQSQPATTSRVAANQVVTMSKPRKA